MAGATGLEFLRGVEREAGMPYYTLQRRVRQLARHIERGRETWRNASQCCRELAQWAAAYARVDVRGRWLATTRGERRLLLRICVANEAAARRSSWRYYQAQLAG